MRTNGIVLAVIGAFIGIVAVVYWFWSHDPAGTTVLTFTFGLAALISYYLLFTARRMDVQPEDRTDAEIADGAGEVGFFSPHSIWPITIASGVACVALGMVFALWLILLGVAIILPAAAGMLFEYYVRDHGLRRHAGSN